MLHRVRVNYYYSTKDISTYYLVTLYPQRYRKLRNWYQYGWVKEVGS